jgi:hypothetical protein
MSAPATTTRGVTTMPTPVVHYAYTPTDTPVCGGYATDTTTTTAHDVTCGECLTVVVDNYRPTTYPRAYVHHATRLVFVATGPGMYGAPSVSGEWVHGSTGVIFPGETLTDGRPVWLPVLCSWCDRPAGHNLTDSLATGDHACTVHYRAWFPWFPRHRAYGRTGDFTVHAPDDYRPTHRAAGAAVTIGA